MGERARACSTTGSDIAGFLAAHEYAPLICRHDCVQARSTVIRLIRRMFYPRISGLQTWTA